MATNPILGELASLSPAAKSALLAAHGATQGAPPVNQGMAAPVAPTHIAPPVDTPPPSLGGAPQMNANPSPSLMGGDSSDKLYHYTPGIKPPTSGIGMTSPGNINAYDRPVVHNPDGSSSTVRSMSYGDDNGEHLIPTVSNGADNKSPHIMSNREAIAYARKTGQSLGTFDTPDHATAFANALHEQQATMGEDNGRTVQQPQMSSELLAKPTLPANGLMGNMEAPNLPTPAPPKAVAAPRGTLMGDQDERNRLISSGSGIHQIENPWLKGLATAGNIIGGAVAPRLMQAIPGTEQHHNLLLNQANAAVGQDVGNAEKQAQTQELGAQTKQREALAEQEQAKAQSLLHPEQHQKEEKPENLQQEYADAVADAVHRGVDPSTDPKVQQWGDAITNLQKQPTPKEQNKDDKFIAIQSKMAAGQPLTPEEKSFAQGYQKFVDVTKTQPGVARTSVLLQMPQAIADPNNPGGLIYSTRRGSIGQGAPGGIETQVPLNVAKSATSGPIANTITSYNTAIGHLHQLGQAADALHNGDLQGINKIANIYGLQTGQAAPVEFQAVKAAVAGEVGKIFKGGAATDNEIKEFDHAISAANSPAQLHGVVNTYTHLMGSKKQALMQQVQQGMNGQPAFNVPQESGHQVGDTVKIKGQSLKVTAVHPDGSFDAK